MANGVGAKKLMTFYTGKLRLCTWKSRILSGLLFLLMALQPGYALAIANSEQIIPDSIYFDDRAIDPNNIDNIVMPVSPQGIPMPINISQNIPLLGDVQSALSNGSLNPSQAAGLLSSQLGVSSNVANTAIQSLTSGNFSLNNVTQALNLAQQGFGSTASSILSLANGGAGALAQNALGQAAMGYVDVVADYAGDAIGFLQGGNTDALSAIFNFSGIDLPSLDISGLNVPGFNVSDLTSGLGIDGIVSGISGQLGGVQNLYNNISSQLGSINIGAVTDILGDLANGVQGITANALNGALNLLNIDPSGIGSQALSMLQNGVPGVSDLLGSVAGMAGLGGVFSSDALSLVQGAFSGNLDMGAALNMAQQFASGLLPPGLAGGLTDAMGLISGLSIDFSNPAAAFQQLANIPGVGNVIGQLSGLLGGADPTAALGSLTNVMGLLGGAGGFNLGSLTSGQLTNVLGSLTGSVPGLSNIINMAGGLGGVQSLLNSSGIMSALGSNGIASNVLSSIGVSPASFGFSGGSGGAGFCCITGHIRLHTNSQQNFWQQLSATQQWVTTTFIQQNVIPAMQKMAEQLSTVAFQQVAMIGMMLDAKHQLESQRLLQQLQAEAHKDYHPSEGMCMIGTNVRSLAESEHFADYNTLAIAKRTMQRQLLSGNVASYEGPKSDVISRLDQFINVYCDPNDNNGDLDNLCQDQERTGPGRKNKDIDFTRTVETQLTLDVDFTGANVGDTDERPDEEDIFALASNLYANEPLPRIDDAKMSSPEVIREQGDRVLLDLRSIAAKRSVAQNSFAAITGMRTAGGPEGAPPTSRDFMYAIMFDLGLNEDEVTEMIGERPSYFAQMEVLTKKLYQNPNFYTELYDKPVNVERKAAALQAIGLMQDRDIYRSLLRSEAVLSVLLESQLSKQQDTISSKFPSVSHEGAMRGAPQ